MTYEAQFYGMDAQPISMEEWARLYEDNRGAGRRVAETTLPDGTWISTVLLGIDHSWGGGVPIIFETMVFPSDSVAEERDMDRYATKEQALEGHEAMVKKWSEVHDDD